VREAHTSPGYLTLFQCLIEETVRLPCALFRSMKFNEYDRPNRDDGFGHELGFLSVLIRRRTRLTRTADRLDTAPWEHRRSGI